MWVRVAFVAAVLVGAAKLACAAAGTGAQDAALAHIEDLRAQGKVEEALAAYDAATAQAERAQDMVRVSKLAHDAAIFALLLERFGDAETRALKALGAEKQVAGAKSGNVAAILNTLAQVLDAEGRSSDALAKASEAVAIAREAFGAQHPNVGATLSTLGKMQAAVGDTGAAEATFLQAIKIEESGLGPDHPAVAGSLNDLAALYHSQLKLDAAETLQKRVVAIAQKAYGQTHPNYATALSALGRNYLDQGRWDDAAAVLTRALDIRRKVLGDKHNDTADAWNDLAWVDMGRGDAKAAQKAFSRSLQVRDAASARDDEATAKGRASLARALRQEADTVPSGRQRLLAEAETQSRRALLIVEQAGLAKRPWVASLLVGLGDAVLQQGHGAQAEDLAERALGLTQIASLRRAAALRLRAEARLQQSKVGLAFVDAKMAAEILEEQRARVGLAANRGEPALAIDDRDTYVVGIRAAYAGFVQHKSGEYAAERDSGFELMQRAGSGVTAHAVWRMAARFAARNDAIAKLLREQQALTLRLPEVEARYARLVSSSDRVARGNAGSAAGESDKIRARLRQLDTELRDAFSAYAFLADPQPIGIQHLQEILGGDEAAVQYVVTERDGYVFAISKTDVTFAHLPVVRVLLSRDVAALRRQLDPSQWEVLPPNIAPFDRALAYRLYQQIWAPVENVVAGKSKVFVVPDGPLTSLPLGLLVTAEPRGGTEGDRNPQALRDTPWLIKRHALITLPSMSSLSALREYAAKTGGNEPFAGFGDPSLGSPGDARGARRRPVADYFRGGVVDQARLAELGSLPATAVELKALAAAAGGSEIADLWLRERATESAIKSAQLLQKRVLAFSTHGLMTGEVGQGEPGLVFTLPKKATARDDGFLAASEIAELKLGAEWVVLSACNTAAGDRPGGEGLSGLARAFFLAGAKSMLVSHWSVWDDASAAITTGTLARFKSKQAPDRAQALRQAMLAVMADTRAARFAHPAAWAPFVLVGEATDHYTPWSVTRAKEPAD